MNISIFGLGYVGCVSLGCLADNGHTVIGVDVVDEKISLINEGKPTIIEKDIAEIVKRNWQKGVISATPDHGYAVKSSEVSVICVGTPSMQNGHLNLEYIFNTAEQIGEALKSKNDFHVVVIRSTVKPGTNELFSSRIEEVSGKKKNVDFGVVSNPEFLREGSAVYDYYNPPYTVIASESDRAIEITTKMYSYLKAPIKIVDIKVAEIIKYVNNAFHALKITFANEVGNICKKLNIDSHEAMDLFSQDNKLNISSRYLKPGFAYGGSCLPKDLRGLTLLAHDNYTEVPVLESIEKSNNRQIEMALEMIYRKNKKNIGIVGISFKEGTDDLRFSPYVELAERLLGKGYSLKIYDPNVNYSNLTGTNKLYIEKHIPHLMYLIDDDLENVVNKSELIIISHNIEKIKDLIKNNNSITIVDMVRMFKEKPCVDYEGVCW